MIYRATIAISALTFLTQPVLACGEMSDDGAAMKVAQSSQPAQQPQGSNMSAGNVNPLQQLAGSWAITAVGTHLTPPDGVTLEFSGEQVSGMAGCNRFTGRAELSDIGIRFYDILPEEKTCDTATMAFETALLSSLSQVDAYTVSTGDELVFYDRLTQPIVKARRMAP